MPKRAPARRTLHKPWRRGYWVNSNHGTRYAKVHGWPWIDNDFHMSKGGVWINSHGYPERAFLRRGEKFERLTYLAIHRRTHKVGGVTYRVRTGAQALEANAKAGVKTEIEIKNLRPHNDDVIREGIQRLAEAAKEAYGDDWQKHVVVKTLTTAGIAYALMICQFAHEAGFTTILLVRGKARYRKFEDVDYVDYVRGSLVVKR